MSVFNLASGRGSRPRSAEGRHTLFQAFDNFRRKAFANGAINVENGFHGAVSVKNWHDHFGFAGTVACNVSWKVSDVVYDQRLALGGGLAAHARAERDSNTRNLSLSST